VISFARAVSSGWLFASLAVAQLAPGSRVADPGLSRWLAGEPVPRADQAAPVATLYHFAANAVALAAAAGELTALQQRHAAQGLVTVVVVRVADAAVEVPLGCRAAVDDAGRARTALGLEPADEVALVDRAGRLGFRGELGLGVADAVEQVLGGTLDFAATHGVMLLRRELPVSFDDAVAAPLRQSLQRALGQAPRDGLLHGLAYLTESTKAGDPAAAAVVLAAALGRLQAEPRALARCADLALRGDPRASATVQQLLPALRAAAGVATADPVVQLALLRALVLAGEERETGRQAMRLCKLATTTAATSLDFASLLAMAPGAPAYLDLAQAAVAQAAAHGAERRLLLAARYGIALRCAEDRAAAAAVLDEFAADDPSRAMLNNAAWYLMTELPTLGRYDAFAAGLAERMLQQREAMEAFEFDTAALAMFQVGRCAEAVALQETAVQRAGPGSDHYSERLRRYRAALPAAPPLPPAPR
jgi:hypothetical protein